MRSGASLAVIAAFCAQGIAHGQSPRLPPSLTPWVAQVGPSLIPPPAPELRFVLSSDSAAIRPTHWLEGGLIGGILVGLLGSQLCNLSDARPPAACYVEAFILTGGAIGFPVGALIGGQFPKHDSPSGEPPPNQRLKLSARGGRLVGNRSILFAAAAGRSLSAIR